MKKPPNKPIKQIQILLDSSNENIDFIELAIEMASQFQAEISVYYIEDSNLMNLAEYPMIREVRITTATPRQLTMIEIQRSIKSQAMITRRHIEIHAKRAQLPWFFTVTNNDKIIELLSATDNSSLIVYTQPSASNSARVVVQNAINKLIDERNNAVLLIRRAMVNKNPICLLVDVDRCISSNENLLLAINMAKLHRVLLRIICFTPKVIDHALVLQQLSNIINAHKTAFSLTILENTTFDKIQVELQHINARLLIIDSKTSLLTKPQQIHLMESVNSPVLII